jgi:hypothetical protein
VHEFFLSGHKRLGRMPAAAAACERFACRNDWPSVTLVSWKLGSLRFTSTQVPGTAGTFRITCGIGSVFGWSILKKLEEIPKTMTPFLNRYLMHSTNNVCLWKPRTQLGCCGSSRSTATLATACSACSRNYLFKELKRRSALETASAYW